MKGLAIGNTHMKYEISILNGLKVMAKVKVFVHATKLTNADADADADTLKFILFKGIPNDRECNKSHFNFFLEKLDDIPCTIIFFLSLDRIVLIVAGSQLSCPERKFSSCNSFRFCLHGVRILFFL